MYYTVLKSKIHCAVVTDAQLNYVGSITIDENLMNEVSLIPNEKVLVVNNNSGARIETYVIKGKPGTGIICLNGSAARHFQKDDVVIIMAFTQMKKEQAVEHKPEVIFPYNHNLDWVDSDQMTHQLLRDRYVNSGKITTMDVEQIALQMGETEAKITKIAETIVRDSE